MFIPGPRPFANTPYIQSRERVMPNCQFKSLNGCSQTGQIIVDPIYGAVQVSDRIAGLLESPLLRRLKGVHQNGSNYLIDPRQNTSRYEHSIGAMILTQKLGGDESKQIAALLHDISHTAFSHVTDLVFANKEQNYHDLVRTQFFESKIAREAVNQFAITEEELSCELIPMIKGPGLNVDRLDYCMRDLARVGRLNSSQSSWIVENLIVDSDGEIKCRHIEMARFIFAKFIEVNQDIYFDSKAEVAAMVLSWILKQMLYKGDLTEGDLFGMDDEIIAKIHSSSFKGFFESIDAQIKFELAAYPCGFHPVLRKLRYVDPKIIGMNGKLTDYCEESRQLLHRYRLTPTIVHYKIPLLDLPM